MVKPETHSGELLAGFGPDACELVLLLTVSGATARAEPIQDAARGGLEPVRVLFSAIFHGVSLGNFHQSSNLIRQSRSAASRRQCRRCRSELYRNRVYSSPTDLVIVGIRWLIVVIFPGIELCTLVIKNTNV